MISNISDIWQIETPWESERTMKDIISFLPDATLAINTEGMVIAWNRSMEEMTGIPAEQMIGKVN
ncbi:MAG: PAS domain-containing protein [Methanobacteriota archaeon]